MLPRSSAPVNPNDLNVAGGMALYLTSAMIFLSVLLPVFLSVFLTATAYLPLNEERIRRRLLPVPLFPHHLDRAHQSIRRVAPIRLDGALRGGGIARADRIDDHIMFGSGRWRCVEQQGDVHPDVAFGLWFHGVV